jgi:hypothetical protein
MSANKDPELEKAPLPPGPMREPLAQAQAGAADNADLCERIDAIANDAIRQACAKKQFDLKSGNCPREGCLAVEKPKIAPCIHLRWGDGPQDHLETDDTEVLCLTVCNPYSNVAFKNVTVQLFILPAGGGAIPNQADGTPSVMIKPSFMICFDDIPPCNPQQPKEASCVSREVVMINRGAIPGKYRIYVIYCFEACFTELAIGGVFEVELVSS